MINKWNLAILIFAQEKKRTHARAERGIFAREYFVFPISSPFMRTTSYQRSNKVVKHLIKNGVLISTFAYSYLRNVCVIMKE